MFGYVPSVPRMQMSMPRPQKAVSTPVMWAARHPVPSVCEGTGDIVRRSHRGLIIDLDDTLYPRERFVRSGLAAVAHHVSTRYDIAADAAYGVMIRALANGRPGYELQALCNRFGLQPDMVPGLIEVFRGHTPTLFLSEGVADTLRALRVDGWGLVVLTNGLPSVQFRKVAALGLTSLVDDIIYAEEHAPGGKPSAVSFRVALRSLELSAGQCICVGDDAARDIGGARSLGMATIRMARPGVTVDPAPDADVVIDSVRQLPAAAARLLTRVTADVA
jgi:putative hydrolase of the HAD superfamily